MLAAIRSAAVVGIDAYAVTVEVDAALGLPQFTVVGLPASIALVGMAVAWGKRTGSLAHA